MVVGSLAFDLGVPKDREFRFKLQGQHYLLESFSALSALSFWVSLALARSLGWEAFDRPLPPVPVL